MYTSPGDTRILPSPYWLNLALPESIVTQMVIPTAGADKAK
jgi:hypothetical protein